MTTVNEGQVAQAVRRDSPWWRDEGWRDRDLDLRLVRASGIHYDPTPLKDIVPGNLYLLYGPRRVGKTVAVKRAIDTLLTQGVAPLQVIRVSVDGWQANRLTTLYETVVRVLTASAADAPRYWFIDEITACRGEWWLRIKDLRDNTNMRNDCVVLTGSSTSHLDDAIKALAGRRGKGTGLDRSLLPMDFGELCHSLTIDVPDIEGLRSDELMTPQARDVWLALAPYTDDLVAAWQIYLEAGGYPQAVEDWHRNDRVEPSTWGSLWDVVRGDALTSGMTEPVLASVLEGLARRIASLVNVSGFAEDVGISRDQLTNRIEDLVRSFLIWECPRADATGRADRRKQEKLYFIDPLVARLPELAHGRPPIDITRLSEQQLGVAVVQWNERVRPGSIRSADWVTHYRGDKGEVDFAGVTVDSLKRMTPLEGKFVSGGWRQDALGIRNSSLGSGLLATRDVTEVTVGEPVWAVPAPCIAFALSRYARAN